MAKDTHSVSEKLLKDIETEMRDINPEETTEESAHAIPKEALELLHYRQENEELKKKMLLALADSENTLKRAKKESDEQKKYAVSGFAKDLINVAENLFRALESAPKEEENEVVKGIINGVEMTRKELMSVFERNGIKRIFPLHEKFDHNFHQAMVEIPDDAAPGTIIQVMQAGYIIHDRLLRAALVGVAKAK